MTKTELESKLDEFGTMANQLSAELFKLPLSSDQSLNAAMDDLRPYLNQIATKARRLASCLRTTK